MAAQFCDVPFLDTTLVEETCHFVVEREETGRYLEATANRCTVELCLECHKPLSKISFGKLQDLRCSFLTNVHKSGHYLQMAGLWTGTNPV